MPSYSDKDIIRAVRKKSGHGWEMFCAQFEPLIESITIWPKWNFSEHEQLDVRQNTYLQLQRALPAFRQKSTLSWFIKRITIHQCIDEIRRQVRRRTIMISPVQKTPDGGWNEMEFENPDSLDPYREMIQTERRQALRAALKQLQETCRIAISLFYTHHLSYQEISEQLKISVNTVGSRLSKCLDKLHKILRRHPLFERNEP